MHLAQLETDQEGIVLPRILDSLANWRMGNGDIGCLRSHIQDGSFHSSCSAPRERDFSRPSILVTRLRTTQRPGCRALSNCSRRVKEGVKVANDICDIRASLVTHSFICLHCLTRSTLLFGEENIFLVTLLEIHRNIAFLRAKAAHSFACG